MPTVIGVRFRRAGRLYYYSPRDQDFAVNDHVVVQSGDHPQLGRVILAPTELAAEEIRTELKEIERKGTPEDVARLEHFKDQAEAALETFRELVRSRDLPVTPLQAEYSFDGANLIFQFSSDERIDYQALARELAEVLEIRVELRQVGPRDRARLTEGLGRCGLSLCCSTWLIEPGNVTVRMAKDQNLPLNPSKISGVCGRLLCCLRYEHEMYLEGPLTTDGADAATDDDAEPASQQASPGRNRYQPEDDLARNFLAPGLDRAQPEDGDAKKESKPETPSRRRSRSRRRRRRR